MITRCDKGNEKQILEYIGDSYPLCLYLYLDYLKYGTDSETAEIYIQTDHKDVQALLLKYYSCLHVFSRDNAFDADELALFFVQKQCTMLYCRADTAEKTYLALPEEMKDKASITRGWVAKVEKIDQAPCGLAGAAEKEDFHEIIRLIYEDEDIGRSYKFDELAKQLEERNQQGYARNLVIKKDGRVIAHACTNAEINGIAVVAELLVREEYRRQGFGSEIWREICSQLLSEGMEVYSFYYTEISRALHKKTGFHEVCEWAKVVIS